MKKLFLLLSLFSLFSASAQQSDNYKPDNVDVPFTETNLPIVFLNVGGRQIDREERITARMKIIYNGEGKLNYADTLAHPDQKVDYEGYIGLKYRGNSSFTNSDKKPYAVRPLDKPLEEGGKKQKISILGMGKDNDWALLAPYSDRSLIRDVFSFTLARPFFEFVPSGKHCELVLDGTYYGVYIFSERVRKGKYRLDLPDPGDLGDELTGGYHLEVDRDDETVYTSKHIPVYSDGTPIFGKKISFQYTAPEYEELTEAQKNYIHSYIDAFENSLASDDYTDPKTGYRKYIDVTSFIDYMLSTEFAHNVDGYRLSTNLYKYRDSKDPRFKMSLWDMNLGFGNADYYDGWRYDTWAYDFNDAVKGNDNQLVPFWWYRLLSDPVFVEEIKARWKEYRETVYSDENITATLDSLVNLLNENGAQQRNFQAWPRWGKYVWPVKYIAESYEDEIAYLRGWIKDRLTFMDKELLGIEPPKPEVTPLSIVSGFNADVIAEKKPAVNHSTMTLDDQGWVLFGPEVQENGSLPTDGVIISNSGIEYRLSAYDGKNAAVLKFRNASATLQFSTPQKTSKLYLLTISANGESSMSVTVNYTDGTSVSKSVSIEDWFSASSGQGEAVYGLGRIICEDNGSQFKADDIDERLQFRLFENEIETDDNKLISSVTVLNNLSSKYPTVLAVTKDGHDVPEGELDTVFGNIAVRVYPNPVKDQRILNIDGAGNACVELINMQGLVVRKIFVNSESEKITLNDLATGMYLLTISNHTDRITYKICIE